MAYVLLVKSKMCLLSISRVVNTQASRNRVLPNTQLIVKDYDLHRVQPMFRNITTTHEMIGIAMIAPYLLPG